MCPAHMQRASLMSLHVHLCTHVAVRKLLWSAQQCVITWCFSCMEELTSVLGVCISK